MGTKNEKGFLQAWAALPLRDRRRLRRLVRLGRPVADKPEAKLAISYARFQRSRAWVRFFWVWFVPGVFLALSIATQMHPIVIGVVLALAAQAVLAHRNLKRVEAVNADLTGP